MNHLDLLPRASEWVELVYFGALLALALGRRRLAPSRRRAAVGLGLAGLGATLAGLLSSAILAGRASSIVRDWLPAPLMLVAYHQAGQFFAEPNQAFQRRLLALDARWLRPILALPLVVRSRWLIQLYCELSYLLCYPLPPLGLAALYLAGARPLADLYWTLLLAPSYFCYGLVPFLPAWPPRKLETDGAVPSGRTRGLNLWILDRASIQANTFPSAHVTSAFGVALALLASVPLAGLLALWFAVSIAVATVLGRYHYLADAVLGAALSVAWYALASTAFAWP